MSADGRLHTRPAGERDPWPAGLRPVDGALLLVPERADPTALVVYFHGAGGTASGGITLWKHAGAEHGVLVLLANSAGSTWDLIRGGLGPDVAALDRQLAAVFERYPLPRVLFSGFSDGASYALSLGLANGDLADTVLAFSPGFLAPPSRAGRPTIRVWHGTDDPVLPIERCGRRVVRELGAAQYPVEFVEFDGGHVVTPELVDTALRASL